MGDAAAARPVPPAPEATVVPADLFISLLIIVVFGTIGALLGSRLG